MRQNNDKELREKIWGCLPSWSHPPELCSAKAPCEDLCKRSIDAIMHFIAEREREAQQRVVEVIYGIANDLANSDPEAIGAVSITPYFANAVSIYQEYLKGDNYERIDWKELKLPTITALTNKSKDIE